jgi:hypothetical protein
MVDVEIVEDAVVTRVMVEKRESSQGVVRTSGKSKTSLLQLVLDS